MNFCQLFVSLQPEGGSTSEEKGKEETFSRI